MCGCPKVWGLFILVANWIGVCSSSNDHYNPYVVTFLPISILLAMFTFLELWKTILFYWNSHYHKTEIGQEDKGCSLMGFVTCWVSILVRRYDTTIKTYRHPLFISDVEFVLFCSWILHCPLDQFPVFSDGDKVYITAGLCCSSDVSLSLQGHHDSLEPPPLNSTSPTSSSHH